MVTETEPRIYADFRQIELLRRRKREGTLAKLQLTQPLWLRKEIAAELGFNAGEEDFLLEPQALVGRSVFGGIPEPTIEPPPAITSPPFVPAKPTPRPSPLITPIIPQPKVIPPPRPPAITLTGDYGRLYQEYRRTGGTLDVIEWGAAGAPLRPGMETPATEEGLQKFLADLAKAGQVSDVENILRLAGTSEEEIDRVVGVETRQRELEGLLAKTFPQYDLEGFAKLVETDPDAFLDKIRTGGYTSDKENLLRMMGASPEEIDKIISPWWTLDYWKQLFFKPYGGKDLKGKFAASFFAGIGDVIKTTGGASRWLGWEDAGNVLSTIGTTLGQVAPPDTLGEFEVTDLFNPEFYATKIARTVPFTLSLLPLALGGYAASGAVAAALGVGKIGSMVIGALGGAALSRPLESAMEAGGAYDDAIARGKTEAEAKSEADEVFRNNMTLAGADAFQIAIALAPTPKWVPSSLIKAGLVRTARVGGKMVIVGLSEGGEELYQDMISRHARGEEWQLDPVSKEVFAIGAVMGLGGGLGGDVISGVVDRAKTRMSVSLRKQFNVQVTSFRAEGFRTEQAELRALDAIAGTPEGEAVVSEAIKEVAPQPGVVAPEAEAPVAEIKPPVAPEPLVKEAVPEKVTPPTPVVPEKVTPKVTLPSEEWAKMSVPDRVKMIQSIPTEEAFKMDLTTRDASASWDALSQGRKQLLRSTIFEKVTPAPGVTSEAKLSSKYGLWDSYTDYGAAIGEAGSLRKLGWQVRITEAQTPTGKKFRVWTTTKRRKIEGHLPYEPIPKAEAVPAPEVTRPQITQDVIDTASKTQIKQTNMGGTISKINPEKVRQIEGYLLAEGTERLVGGNFRNIYVWKERRWSHVEGKLGARAYSKADTDRVVSNLKLREKVVTPTAPAVEIPKAKAAQYPPTVAGAEARAKAEGISISEASRLNAEEALKAPAPEVTTKVSPLPKALGKEIIEKVNIAEHLGKAKETIRALKQRKAVTEESQKILVDTIKEHLPLSHQGELLSKVKNVKTPEQLAEFVTRIEELAEAQAEKTLRADIIRELSRTKPRVERGITVGRLSPEVQPTIDKLRANLLVGIKGKGGVARNVEAYEAARAKIEQGIADYRDGKITWDALLEANEELKYVGMYGMSTAQLQEALDYILELKRLGKDLRKIKLDEIKEQRKEVVDKAVIEVTGGEGIKPGVGTLRGKDLAGIKKVLDQPVNSQYGFVNLLDKLGKFAKGTKMFEGFLMRFADLSQRATNTENAGREATFKIVRDKFREIYGVKKTREATRLLTTLSQEEIDLGTFKITTKEGVKYLPLKLTKAEMMEAYQLYKNPKNLETFKDGMHWTPEIIIKIVNTLTAQDIAWADWLQAEFYSGYYDRINPFYREEFNIDMPKNPDYVPQSRDFEAEVNELDEVRMLFQDQKRYASVTNKSLKARQENIRPFQFKGVFTVLTNHIVQMEHFMAWAETMHELRSTFGNKEVRTAIRQYHSNDILRRLDDYMDDFARGGVDRIQFLNTLDKLRSNFAVSVLAIKPSIGLQQIWTVGAFMTEMKVKDFVTGFASFWVNPVANYQWMMENSTYIKNRYSGGNYERDIRLAQQQGVAKTMSGAGNLSQWLLWQVTQGDKFGVMPGWWAKYRSGLKVGLSQADAMIQADLASERTQNTSELASLSWLQRATSWGKLLTMFQSQPNKYFRIVADNIRNMQYGRQSKVKGISNILIVWIILPMLFQWVADAFRWEKEKQARVLVLGPLNNILVAGQLIQTAWGWFTDDSFDWQVSPVLSTVRDFQNFSSKLKKIIGVIKDPYNDVAMDDIVSAIEFFSKGIGQLIGAPTPYLIMVERAIRDGDPRELVFSRWALEEPTPDLQGKTAKIVGQYGQVIEDVTDLPIDKKPPVYDTKKGFSEVKQALSKTLPQDVTEKNGFSPQVIAIAQAIIAQDILETYPSKKLYEIIDDILKDDTLNYTFSQYYMDYQDRQKITSLAELKEWDAEHPRFNLGNVTPTQYALMRQYEGLETDKEKKQFRLDHPEMDINNRIEWLKKNPEQNALLALHGQAKLLTKEAYTEFKRLIKELDIPDSAIPVSEIWGEKVITMPSDELITANFERNDIIDEWGANSWEDKLLRAKNPELNKWLGLGDIDTPIASLELKTEETYRTTYNKLKKEDDPDWVGNLDDKIKDKDGLTARDRAIAELKVTKIGDMTWIDIDRKVEAIEKGTDEAPTPDSLVNLYIERGKSIDKPGVGSSSAEVMLQRVDNPDFDAWLTDAEVWGDRALEPIDRDKVPVWRIDVKMAGLDEGSPEYALLSRQKDAYTNGFSDMVDTYVGWFETPKAGYYDDWFLMENDAFYKRMVAQGLLSERGFSKVPDIKWRDEWDSMPPRKQEAIIIGVPESYTNPEAVGNPIDDYVAFYDIPPKPEDYPEGFPNWEDDWWMMEHPDFYKEVYLNKDIYPDHKRKDYRKVPIREVWAKYQHYDSLDFRADQDKYRLDNPDLDNWGVLYGIWTETMTEKRRRMSISSAERISAEIEERLKKLKETVKPR